MTERYVKKLTIEVETLGIMVDTYIVPAALKEQRLAGESIRALTEVNRSADIAEQTARLKLISDSVSEILARRRQLRDLLNRCNKMDSENDRAHLLSQEGMALMSEVRVISDRLEEYVSDEYWPLPKYREMLFTN